MQKTFFQIFKVSVGALLFLLLGCQQDVSVPCSLMGMDDSVNIISANKSALPIGENYEEYNTSHFRLGDFNHDNKTDFLYYFDHYNAWSADVYISTGTTFIKNAGRPGKEVSGTVRNGIQAILTTIIGMI